MASDIVSVARELELSMTDYVNLLLARKMGHDIPWWVQKKLRDDYELPLGQKPLDRRRRQTGVTRLVLVAPGDPAAAGDGRQLGVRVPDALADDIIRKADDLGLSIGDCTALLLAQQLDRPVPAWVVDKLRDDGQLLMGA